MTRMYDRNPYAILGISPTATTSQVKEAYHKLARQYHPDVNRDPRADERMKDINWANDILSDPQERSLYDYWRNSSVRTEYYYPGTSPTDSTGSRTYNSYPRRTTYSNAPTAQGSSSVGCAPWGIILVFIIVITNLVRAIGPAVSQQNSYNYSPEIRAAQTAEMEIELTKLDSAIETLHASDGHSTPGIAGTLVSSFPSQVTPSPVSRLREDAEPVQESWRTRIVPGTWEYSYIRQYFPELTTPNGLSDEVTDVIYHQLDGYQIKTRSSGEYWLYISPYDNGVSPEHIPPRITSTPTR